MDKLITFVAVGIIVIAAMAIPVMLKVVLTKWQLQEYEAREKERETRQGEHWGTCTACGKLISSGNNFCPQCGANLKEGCPGCGMVNRVGAKYCMRCGRRLPERFRSIKRTDGTPLRYVTGEYADYIQR